MSQDVSGFGLRVQIVASVTFPQGVIITQFADDSDPADFPSIQIGDSAMGLNGDLVRWSKANKLPMTLNVIPGSDDDQNLDILFEANRVGLGKFPAGDTITAVVIQPDGAQKTYTGGNCENMMGGPSVSNQGRKKSKPYTFGFENRTGAPG